MYFRYFKDPVSLWTGVSASELTRRDFLKFTSLAGAGLTLGALLPERAAAAGASAAATPALAMPFLRVDPDNTVTVTLETRRGGAGCVDGIARHRRRRAGCLVESDARGELAGAGAHVWQLCF